MKILLQLQGGPRARRYPSSPPTFPDDIYRGYPQRPLKPDTSYQVVVEGGKLGGTDDLTARFKYGNADWSFRTAE
jgi:hypothetical protein